MFDSQPIFVFTRRLLSERHCDQLIRVAERDNGKHWDMKGTFMMGTPTQSLLEYHGECVPTTLEKIRKLSVYAANLMNISVSPSDCKSLHITKWERQKGTVGEHHDCDMYKRQYLQDAKLSVYISLQDNGGLRFREEGWVECNKGDSIIFNTYLGHSVTDGDREKTRYSMVAWILGPRWR